uniref:Uncharacterized protein n=1 Tax=Strigamia maritima TaxID=126957 RepID=T1IM43_STRMM
MADSKIVRALNAVIQLNRVLNRHTEEKFQLKPMKCDVEDLENNEECKSTLEHEVKDFQSPMDRANKARMDLIKRLSKDSSINPMYPLDRASKARMELVKRFTKGFANASKGPMNVDIADTMSSDGYQCDFKAYTDSIESPDEFTTEISVDSAEIVQNAKDHGVEEKTKPIERRPKRPIFLVDRPTKLHGDSPECRVEVNKDRKIKKPVYSMGRASKLHGDQMNRAAKVYADPKERATKGILAEEQINLTEGTNKVTKNPAECGIKQHIEPMERLAKDTKNPLDYIAKGTLESVVADLIIPVKRMIKVVVDPVERLAKEPINPVERIAIGLMNSMENAIKEPMKPIERTTKVIIDPVERLAKEPMSPMERLTKGSMNPVECTIKEPMNPMARLLM